MKIFFRFFFISLIVACSTVKQISLTDDELKANLKRHVSILASDTNESGAVSMNYLIAQFKEAGLKPKGEKKFVQQFPFTVGADFGKSTQLYINSKSFKVNDDFYPLQYSGNGIFIGYTVKVGYGIYAPQLNHNDYNGKINIAKKIFVIESSTPEGKDTHGKHAGYDLFQRVANAIALGAAAVIFINSDSTIDDPKPDFIHRFTSSTVPVIFAKGEAARTLKNDIITNCVVGVQIEKIEKKTDNVIGYINNTAATTVIISSYGGRTDTDGAAALIEIARYLTNKKDQKNNYLFIAFPGKEKGLLGSEYFIKHSTVDLKKVNYMINIENAGRINPDTPALIINGVGTSPLWKTVIDISGLNGLVIKTTQSSIIPSVQTSFYLDSIPVLNFSGESKGDYHQTSDNESNLNYDGEVKIIRTIIKVIDALNDKGKLPFVKIKSNSKSERLRLTPEK